MTIPERIARLAVGLGLGVAVFTASAQDVSPSASSTAPQTAAPAGTTAAKTTPDYEPIATTPVSNNPALRVFSDKKLGIRLEAPKEWFMTTLPNKLVSSTTNWFMAVNNQRPGLNLANEAYGVNFVPDAGISGDTPQRMQPGEVYVAIGTSSDFQGIFSDGMPYLDTVGDSLQVPLGLVAVKKAGEINQMAFSVIKHDQEFDLLVVTRDPVSTQDRASLQKLLESFQFVAAPVGTPEWATHLAWEQLPERYRHAHYQNRDFRQPAPTGPYPQQAHLSYISSDSSGAFLIRGAAADNTTWSFLVAENGTVKQLSGPVNPDPERVAFDGWGGGWGRFVGLSMEISAVDLAPKPGSPITFTVDFHNQRNGMALLPPLPQALQRTGFIKVDGQVYVDKVNLETGLTSNRKVMIALGGQLPKPVTVTLDPTKFFADPGGNVQRADQTKPLSLALTPGWHTARWSMETLGTTGGAPRMWSNAVDFLVPILPPLEVKAKP